MTRIIISALLSSVIIVVGTAAGEMESKAVSNIDNNKSKALITPLISGVNPAVHTDKIEAVNFIRNGKQVICGIDTSDESMACDSLSIWFSVKENNIWQSPESVKICKFINGETPVESHFCDGPAMVSINDSLYLHLSYENNAIEDNSVKHIEVMIDLSDTTVTYGIFSGKRLNGRKLEGRLMDYSDSGTDESVMKFISHRINESSQLVTISPSDALSDELMERWKTENKRADDDARSIRFIPIPEESSISNAYKTRKFGKEKDEKHSAILMNFRGNTIICSSDKENRLSLVWCEEQCTDKTSGKYLHTIFFEQKSTITLFYYHGRKSFKYRIDLETGRITR